MSKSLLIQPTKLNFTTETLVLFHFVACTSISMADFSLKDMRFFSFFIANIKGRHALKISRAN
ncbi:Uncharacterised protein [Moraxella bovis]|uniref:Uncharacterized protein n=1 Tax=Moraxella bovis TaxID=476 RepID=A0A378PNP4_MORBO|nr:Uncharacterised protein [Moraxella bovis]